MRKMISLILMSYVFMPGVSLADSDAALANMADTCNSTAYDALKPQRDAPGARTLMSKSSTGRKYAKWMKKYLNLISTCASKAYLPDCKPASKIEDYYAKLKESREKLEENMLNNYVCNATLVNKFVSENTPPAEVKSLIGQKVNEFLNVSDR